MKTFITGILMVLLLIACTPPKSATVHITIKNFKGSVSVIDPELRYDLTKNKFSTLNLDTHGSASYTVITNKPTYLVLYPLTNSLIKWCLFLSPGDELFLSADFAKKNNAVTVTGKGSNNNQPEIFALTNGVTQPFHGDKNPDRVIAALNKQYLLNKSILTNYIKANKPSDAFIKNATDNLKYFVPSNYYAFSHNNNFFKPKEELKPWLRIQDSLFATIKLSNDEALNICNYDQLVDDFMLRETEAYQMEYRNHPALYYKQWFHTDPVKGDSAYKSWYLGIITKKIVDKYFTGKASEYAYAQAIKYRFSARADYPAVVSIFNYFKKEYPHSVYLKEFNAPIAAIVSKQQKGFSSKTIFVKNNGIQLNTFKDVLAITKGKVALVDMWGTWCTPCRQEIEKNAKKLEEHFKGKNVNFIYVANMDIKREQEWKKAIAYFQIEGMQILANPALTNDIMGKVKSSGYPTYIIIKKDGSYSKTATQLPVNVKALTKEIEAANL